MATITIDGQQYTVDAGKNLLEVCLSVEIDLPYFCWHPAMGSVGACRQCAAKQFADENDSCGWLVTACMTPVQDGNIFSVADTQAVDFRATVIESLMTNHPHDCPVCEEGGECHLQDMTEMSGHTLRRYRGKKRTHRNQYLGPLINHEMNRCISCYRCVRFYKDYAGGKDLSAQASHNHVYFGREKSGVLENEFAGNLVEVCPTGVFTDKTFSAHYSRKWDLQTAPGICHHCAVGCNTTPGSRYDSIRRVVNRYHSEINGYFLCDRGRFGYAYNHHAERLMTVENRAGDELKTLEKGLERLVSVASELATGKAFCVGVGSPRSSLENNFALREFVGVDNFYHGVSSADYVSHRQLAQLMVERQLDIASISDAEKADAIIILGEDIAETAPRMSLALRQAVGNKRLKSAADVGIDAWQDAAVRHYSPYENSADANTPLLIASLTSTRLDDVAAATIHSDPQHIAQLGFYIAATLSGKTSDVELSLDEKTWADAVIATLEEASQPIIVAGCGYQQPALLESSINIFSAIKSAKPKARYYYALPEVNSLGLALLTQDRTLDQKLDRKDHTLLTLWEQLTAVKKQGRRTVMIVLENDLYRRMEHDSVAQLLEAVDELIVLDHLRHPTTQQADWCLPVSTAFESQGTLVSAEGRAQRSYSVLSTESGLYCNARHAWRWLVDAVNAVNAVNESRRRGSDVSNEKMTSWQHCDDITRSISQEIDCLGAITSLIPEGNTPLARQSHRYSGRTAMHANIAVAETKPTQDTESPFNYSMEGRPSHGPLENSAWSPGWNSNQAIHKFQQDVAGRLRGGESGLRLFEFSRSAPAVYFQQRLHHRANVYEKSSDKWLLFPLQSVFGSDELSARADAIAELTLKPCVFLNKADAEALHVVEWDTLLCSVKAQFSMKAQQQLYVRIDDVIPSGVAGALLLVGQHDQGLLSSHWPVAVELVKDASSLPKPIHIIASSGESDYVR
ncbi:MAG: NADH-quinone oxidoreductase subunit NuoG [Pseudomonadales bacterium]